MAQVITLPGKRLLLYIKTSKCDKLVIIVGNYQASTSSGLSSVSIKRSKDPHRFVVTRLGLENLLEALGRVLHVASGNVHFAEAEVWKDEVRRCKLGGLDKSKKRREFINYSQRFKYLTSYIITLLKTPNQSLFGDCQLPDSNTGKPG